MLALLYSKSNVNAIYPIFAKKLDFIIRLTDIKFQKIDGISLHAYTIVVIAVLVIDKINQIRFFEKPFLMTNFSSEVVLGMHFFTLNGANIDF